MNYPDHIQADFDHVIPFWRKVLAEVEKASPLSPVAIMEYMDRWRHERGNAQSDTMLNLAIQEDKTSHEGPFLKITDAAVERLKTMDLKGITTGPGTRMLVGLTEEHDQLELNATQVRQILNRVAADLAFDIKKHIPEIVPFMQGRSSKTELLH